MVVIRCPIRLQSSKKKGRSVSSMSGGHNALNLSSPCKRNTNDNTMCFRTFRDCQIIAPVCFDEHEQTNWIGLYVQENSSCLVSIQSIVGNVPYRRAFGTFKGLRMDNLPFVDSTRVISLAYSLFRTISRPLNQNSQMYLTSSQLDFNNKISQHSSNTREPQHSIWHLARVEIYY